MPAPRLRWAFVLAFAGVLAVPHLAAAAELSADVVMSGTGISATATIYIKGKNFRMEMTYGQHKGILIINADKKMLWSLDPAAKTYAGTPVTAEVIAANMDQLRGRLPAQMRKAAKTKRLGTETVNGYRCEKTQTEIEGRTVTTWYSKKLDLALKTETKTAQGQQFRQEVKNIKVRTLPASLFTVPKGYKEVKAPAAGPGGRRGPSSSRRPPAGR